LWKWCAAGIELAKMSALGHAYTANRAQRLTKRVVVETKLLAGQGLGIR